MLRLQSHTVNNVLLVHLEAEFLLSELIKSSFKVHWGWTGSASSSMCECSSLNSTSCVVWYTILNTIHRNEYVIMAVGNTSQVSKTRTGLYKRCMHAYSILPSMHSLQNTPGLSSAVNLRQCSKLHLLQQNWLTFCGLKDVAGWCSIQGAFFWVLCSWYHPRVLPEKEITTAI